MSVQRAIRFLANKVAVHQVRREWEHADRLEKHLQKISAVEDEATRETAIVVLAMHEGFTPEATA